MGSKGMFCKTKRIWIQQNQEESANYASNAGPELGRPMEFFFDWLHLSSVHDPWDRSKNLLSLLSLVYRFRG